MSVLRKAAFAVIGTVMSTSVVFAHEPMSAEPEVNDEFSFEMPLESASDKFRAWCDRRLGTLDRHLNNAQRKIAQGNYVAALNILMRGLDKASQNNFSFVPPMTQKLIYRANIMAKRILRVVSKETVGVKATVLFLEEQYNLIEQVANEIDMPVYMPCYRRGRCAGLGYGRRFTREMEHRLLEFIVSQLSHLQDAFVSNYAPVGPTSLYLHAAEMVANSVIKDLEFSLFRTDYSCAGADLVDVKDMLYKFNRTYTNEYQKREMFYQAYELIDQATSDLSNGGSCY